MTTPTPTSQDSAEGDPHGWDLGSNKPHTTPGLNGAEDFSDSDSGGEPDPNVKVLRDDGLETVTGSPGCATMTVGEEQTKTEQARRNRMDEGRFTKKKFGRVPPPDRKGKEAAGKETEDSSSDDTGPEQPWFPLFPPSSRRFWFNLFENSQTCFVAGWLSNFIFTLILVSSVAGWIESLAQYKYPNYGKGITAEGEQMLVFGVINTFCMWCFTIEYFIRFIAVWGAHPILDLELPPKMFCPEGEESFDEEKYGTEAENYEDGTDPEYMADVKAGTVPGALGTWYLWVKMPLTIIDFLAIFPFVVEVTGVMGDSSGGGGTTALRIFRMFRVFRVLKLQKQTIAIAVFLNTIVASAGPLMILAFFLALATLVFGSVIFLFEGGQWNPNAQEYMRVDQIGYGLEKTSFTTTFMAMYWVLETVTTVGYGDLYPSTLGGRVVGAAAIVLGIIVFAMPITIIGDTFAVEYERLSNLIKSEDKEFTAWVDNVIPYAPTKHSNSEITGQFSNKMIQAFLRSMVCKKAFKTWLQQEVARKGYDMLQMTAYVKYIQCEATPSNPYPKFRFSPPFRPGQEVDATVVDGYEGKEETDSPMKF